MSSASFSLEIQRLSSSQLPLFSNNRMSCWFIAKLHAAVYRVVSIITPVCPSTCASCIGEVRTGTIAKCFDCLPAFSLLLDECICEWYSQALYISYWRSRNCRHILSTSYYTTTVMSFLSTAVPFLSVHSFCTFPVYIIRLYVPCSVLHLQPAGWTASTVTRWRFVWNA